MVNSTNKIRWIDRKFSFDFPVSNYPEILERLRGTPSRFEDIIDDIPKEVLKLKKGKSWSIQEHIGHLVSIESLMTGRLNDYESGKKELRAADMTNKKTEESKYNEKSIELILEDLIRVREKTVKRIESLRPEQFSEIALHPRLQVPMRLVDIMYFFAEHDDYHLARISELIQIYKSKTNDNM